MNITKGQFLQLLNSINPDPQLLAKIIVDTFQRLPEAYAWQLSQQLYVKYFWKGDVYTLTNNLTGVSRMFTSVREITQYLSELGYKASPNTIRNAIKNREPNCYNHKFDRPDTEQERSGEYDYGLIED